LKKSERKFYGDFDIPLSDLREKARKEYPDGDIERLARDKRNFNNKHLRAYLKGHQIFFFGKDNFNKPIPFVV